MFAAAVGSAEATEAWYRKQWIKLVADVRVALSFTMNLVGYGLSFVPRCHVSRGSIRYVVSFFKAQHNKLCQVSPVKLDIAHSK